MNNPLVSIILPIRNESAYIGRVLSAILAQDYPGDCLEILIADGMSDDDTRAIINNFAVLHPQPKVTILDNPWKIVSTGINAALRQAKGEIIIRVDGHCIIAPDYVSRCVERIQNDGADGVGGSMETIGETPLAQAIAIGVSSPFGVGNSAFRTVSGKNMPVDTVPFPAYTRKIIERVGLYDEELIRNQDDEYNYRIRESGGKILMADDVCSTYFSRTSLRGLRNQYFRYGYWKVRVLQKHPRQMRLRQFAPPVFVLALLFSTVFVFIPMVRFLFYSIFLAYLLANLSASLWTAFRRGWPSLPFLPVIFVILHFSYGTGFLIGLLKFAGRWGDKQGKTPVLERKYV